MLSREELHRRGWRRNPAPPCDASWLCEADGTPPSFPPLLTHEVQWLEARVDAAVREALERAKTNVARALRCFPEPGTDHDIEMCRQALLEIDALMPEDPHAD